MTLAAILASKIGLVVAPAGCGKTQLIVEALKIPTRKPYLVLTHTTAGVAALHKRLKKSSVSKSNYRIATIAGWALNIASIFPVRSGFQTNSSSSPNYTSLHYSIAALCKQGHINDIISASYSKLFVDEYQDCSTSQHSLICAISSCLSTIIFGDPMQAIFDFNRRDPLPDWNNNVAHFFPIICNLDKPWRWINSGNEDLGRWLLDTREKLSKGQSINLKNTGTSISWSPISGDQQNDFQLQNSVHSQLHKSMLANESLLIIGDSISARERHSFAKDNNGIGVVEPVDLKDIICVAQALDDKKGRALLECLLTFASSVMTKVGKSILMARIDSISLGKNRTPPTPVEFAALQVIKNSVPQNIMELLTLLEQNRGCRVYREIAFSVLKGILLLSKNNLEKNITDSAFTVIEQRRHDGDKRVPSRAIGSTLLLKGLEADHVMILNASPNKMNSRHLYVALSRGARSVTVFSLNSVVGGTL